MSSRFRLFVRAIVPVGETVRKGVGFAYLLLLALIPQAVCHAQSYPQRVVRVVVPYPPGSGVDGFTRMLADELSKRWKQAVVVENKAGGASLIGAEAVARSVPDGYTLLLTADSPITGSPHLFKKLSFDPLKDLTPVMQIGEMTAMIVVHPSVNVSTIAELVALAKQKPGDLTYSGWGAGSPPHLMFESLKSEYGAQIRDITYKGAAPATTAVVAGEVHLSAIGSTALPQISAGKLKALAVCRPKRMQALPDTPTCAEAGYPNLDPKMWLGMLVPAGTPTSVISTIHTSTADVLANPDFAKELFRTVFYKVASTPAEFARLIKEDFEVKKRLIRNSGIVPE